MRGSSWRSTSLTLLKLVVLRQRSQKERCCWRCQPQIHFLNYVHPSRFQASSFWWAKIKKSTPWRSLCLFFWLDDFSFRHHWSRIWFQPIALDQGQSPSMICLLCQKRNRAAAPDWMMTKLWIYQQLGDFSWILLQPDFARSTNPVNRNFFLYRRVIQRQKNRSQSVQNILFHTPSYPSDKLMLRDDEARDLLKNAQQSRLRKVVGNLSSVVQLEMLMTQKWHRQLAGFIWFYGVLGISGISRLEVFLCNLLWRMSLVTSSMNQSCFFCLPLARCGQPPSLILPHCQVLDCLKAIWESGVGGEVRMDRDSTGPDTRPVMFGRDA